MDHREENRGKHLARYLLPSVASLVGLSFYILADTLFVANGVGPVGLAALNIAIPGYSVVTATGLLLGAGGGVMVSVARGRGDREGADRVFGCVMAAAVGIGLALSLLGITCARPIALALGASEGTVEYAAAYLRVILGGSLVFVLNNALAALVRNDGNPKLAMASMLTTSLGNVVLDYLFVMVIPWGMTGAAAATCIAAVLGVGLLSLHWATGRNSLRLSRRPSLRPLAQVVRGGAPSMITELGNALVIFLFNATLMGLAGDTGVAAYGIVANIALVISYVFVGIGQGLQPVVGYRYGQGDQGGCAWTLRVCLTVAGALGVLFTLAGLLFPQGLAALFNSSGDPELARLTVEGIRIYFFGFLAMGLNICLCSYFQAVLRPRLSVALSTLRALALVVAGIALFPRIWGLPGVWLVVPVAEGLTLLTCLACVGMERMRRKA